MTAPTRRAVRAGILLLAALLLLLLRERLAQAVTAQIPAFSAPLISLALRTLTWALLLAGIWQLRGLLLSLWSRLIGFVDRTEERLVRQMSPRRARWVRAITVGLLIGGTANLLIETTPYEQQLEASLVDRWFNLRFPQRSMAEMATEQTSDPPYPIHDVVVIGIDDETISRLGWPLPRYTYARLIDAVSTAHPATLSFDLALLDPSRDHPDWDRAIADAAARAGNVFFTLVLSATPGNTTPVLSDIGARRLADNLMAPHDGARQLPDFSRISRRPMSPTMVMDVVAQKAHGLAIANVSLDGDDVLRHSLTVAHLGDRFFPSLSLRIAAAALDVPLARIDVHPGSHVDLGGKRRIPIDVVGRSLVRYQGRHSTGPGGAVRYLSMWSLIRPDVAVTLAGSPMGDDQEFVIDESTRVDIAGQPASPQAAEVSALKPGSAISGIARYSSDPGRILQLKLSTARPDAHAEEAPSDGDTDDVPAFEVLDEDRLQFTTRVGKLRRLATAPHFLAGKHVLVGSTALAATDTHNGPLGGFPGVEHHATMLHNILQGDFFRSSPLWLRLIETLILALLAALIGTLASPSIGLVLGALLLSMLIFATYFAFDAGLHVPMVAPAGALLFSYGLGVLLSFRAEGRARARAEEGREFVRRTFGRYLTDQVVQQILDSPDGLRLGGQRRFVTIMMTDLRGFTSMCGSMEPEAVVSLLNHYLEAMTRIITRYGGTIDEFIGDAILVVFGAPLSHADDELRAVACAIEMLNAMADVNRWNSERGLPAVEMGIGIHSGEAVLGNIGSEMRAKYGIVGSTINLTSRVESCTVGGQVLISQATYGRCAGHLTVGSTQTISPKGVKGTLAVYEVLAVGDPYSVTLAMAQESLVEPAAPLSLRYAVLKDKQVGELTSEASVEALSEQGLELRLLPTEQGAATLDPLANLQLRLVAPDGSLRPGDLYGKVLRTAVRPGVVYVRLTSVPPESRAVLSAARVGQAVAPAPVLDGPLASE